MLKEPTISYGGKKRSICLVTGFVAAGVILACIVFPEIVFAAGSIVPLQTTLPTNPPENGVAPEPKTQHETVAEEPTTASSAQDAAPAHTNFETDGSWRVVRMRVTGYCPCSKCCGAYSDGITANNHRIQPGDTFVAASKSYPFGTEMVIPGYNSDRPVQVMDRGGAIKGNRLDLFFHTHQAALVWGVQHVDVLIKAE
ncbi:MAG: 3D domain-containing protein [Planctomycetota bacterium]